MRVLVTGSDGNIGKEQVRQLLEAGHEVRGLDRTAQRKGVDYEYLSGDIRDIYLLRKAVAGMDAVMHLGAIPSDRHGHSDDVLSTNVQGTWNLLIACVEAGVGRVINYSSINALGCVGGYKPAISLPIDDAYPRHPYSPYQLSKHLGEEACACFTARHGLVTLSFRPTWVADPTHYEWFHTNIERVAGHSKVEYWAYVDRRDVCRAAMLALTLEGVQNDAFLLSAKDTTVNIPTPELLETYYADTPWHINRDAYLSQNTYRALVDTSHAKEVLGWEPRHSWRDEEYKESVKDE